MNPLRVRATNYRSFGRLDFELPAGVAAITGENGAGKSSLVNLIDLALFGPEGRSWAPYLTQGGDGTELEVELEFEHAGAVYRVRRGYSARGSGKTTLDLETLAGGMDIDTEGHAIVWEPVTLEGQKATQELVEGILGLTRETFRASAMLVQGDAAAFTEAKPADRKRVLSAVLGLDRFDRQAELVKADRKAAGANVERLTGALERADLELAARSDVERRLAVAREILADADKEYARCEVELQEAAKAAAAVEAARTTRAEADAAVSAAEAALQPLEQRATDAADAEREIGIANDEVLTLTTVGQRAGLDELVKGLEAELEGYRQKLRDRAAVVQTRALREREREAIVAQAKTKRAEEAKLDEQTAVIHAGELHTCPTCEQTLGAEARDSVVANLRARAQVAADEAAALEQHAAGVELPEIPAEPEPPVEIEHALSSAKAQLDKARADELQTGRLAGRITALQQRAAAKPPELDVEKARQSLLEARAAAAALPPAPDDTEATALQARALSARARLEQERIRSDAAKANEIRETATLERLDKIAADTATDRVERDRLLTLIDRLAIVERGCGRDGIPSMLVESLAIPAIEAEADRILDEFGTSYRVELRTSRALAGGGTADALDIVVTTELGERGYEWFSGGEKTRLNLALRIALAGLLSSRRDAESKILTIDEPDGLDEAGMAALVRVLQGLNGTFSRSYLISHVPDLALAFDQSLVVRRNGDGLSVVETA